jgi:hypothetical protein
VEIVLKVSEGSRRSNKGNRLANKSFQSSEAGNEDSHAGDPEFHRDFNKAYQKVSWRASLKNFCVAGREDLQ